MTAPQPAPPASVPVLRRALLWGACVGLAITVVGAVVGLLVSGPAGLAGGAIGGVIAILFPGMSAASILIANRFSASPVYTAVFFAIVLGGWILKFIVFIVLVMILRGQPWLDPVVLFVTLVAAILASLVVDVVVVARTRLPYVSDAVLPGDRTGAGGADGDSYRDGNP